MDKDIIGIKSKAGERSTDFVEVAGSALLDPPGPGIDERSTFEKRVLRSVDRLTGWIERNEYKGYEPFDGLSSWLRPLTFRSWFGERLLQQFVLRFPLHIRPAIGVKPQYSTKGMGLMARGFLRLWQATKDDGWLERAIFCLDWLIDNQTKGYSGACWGNHFDYSSRGFQLPERQPTQVWAGLIGQAFLDGYEVTGDDRYLETARSTCVFVMKDLPREEFHDSCCIGYVTFDTPLIHNSNMLGAALLARVYTFTKEESLIELSNRAVRFTCRSQLENGAWYYGEESKHKWIDNWHTCYNLDSLKWYLDCTGDPEFEASLRKGFAFFKERFFTGSGVPKFYADRLAPIDIQVTAQAIDTLSFFSGYDDTALPLAKKVANRAMSSMQDRTGYFYFRKLRFKTVRIPMLHWGQATMLSALGHLVKKLVTGR